VPRIAEIAADPAASATSDPDLMKVVEITTNLLAACRAMQSSYLDLARK
jgi:hypothetical protein